MDKQYLGKAKKAYLLFNGKSNSNLKEPRVLI